MDNYKITDEGILICNMYLAKEYSKQGEILYSTQHFQDVFLYVYYSYKNHQDMLSSSLYNFCIFAMQ